MLGFCDQEKLTLPEWDAVPSRARLPVAEEEFLAKEGPLPIAPESRRSYNRLYMRTRALAMYNGEFHAIYLSDISRSGLGIFSPIQLLPSAAVSIFLPNGRQLDTTLKTCVRVEDACYRCGVEFGMP